jgi:DNA replication licensing factor MCM3
VLDKTDDEFNRSIAEHITRLHRYVPAGLEEGAPMTETLAKSLAEVAVDVEKETASVFQKYNELLHIGVRPGKRKDTAEILSIPFLKKYMFYAKNRIKPVLTPDACDFISNKYAELRSKTEGKDDQYRTMPITPRTLETLIRLSTAHAKVRLSKTVDVVILFYIERR